MWFSIILGLFFIFMGLSVHVFKWYFLISGYNTMPKAKKANVDTAGLGRLMGIYGYVNGGIFLLQGVLQASGFEPPQAPAYAFFILSTLYLLVKAQKYDGNIFDKDGKIKKGAGKQLLLPATIGIIALLLVGVLLFYSSRPTEVAILDDGIEISGMYGAVYKWEMLNDVKLVEELPTLEVRTNGSAVGSHLKGHFRTKELGPVKLFVDAEEPPFIYLETASGIIIFNLDDANATERMFAEIQSQREAPAD